MGKEFVTKPHNTALLVITIVISKRKWISTILLVVLSVAIVSLHATKIIAPPLNVL
jgi:hypothetical protein